MPLSRTPTSIVALLAAALLALLVGACADQNEGGGDGAASASSPEQASGSPCPGETRPYMKRAEVRRATIPGPERDYETLVMAPSDTDRYPGRRPAIAIQHGVGSDYCNLFWFARYLAGHGFVAIAYSAPDPASGLKLRQTVVAMRAAIDFAGTRANPLLARTDPEKIGVTGFSLGAVTTSVVQADREVDAAVALDNLRRWREGDPGGVGDNCTGPRRDELEVNAPSLGFAQDEACRQRPSFDPPGLKQYAFRHWRAADVASMELVLRDFMHVDYGGDGSDARRKLVGRYALAWFDRWLLDDESATDRLLATSVGGKRSQGLLSRDFRSAAYIPGTIDTTNLRPRLSGR